MSQFKRRRLKWDNYSPVHEKGPRCHDCGKIASLLDPIMFMIWCKKDSMFGDPYCCGTGHATMLYCEPCIHKRLGKVWREAPNYLPIVYGVVVTPYKFINPHK